MARAEPIQPTECDYVACHELATHRVMVGVGVDVGEFCATHAAEVAELENASELANRLRRRPAGGRTDDVYDIGKSGATRPRDLFGVADVGALIRALDDRD